MNCWILTKGIGIFLILLCLSGSNCLVAQKISVDREMLKEVVSKAEKYELIAGENTALKVRLTNLEDSLNTRNATLAVQNKTILQLRDDVKRLRTYRLLLFVIGGLAVGVLVWRLFGR